MSDVRLDLRQVPARAELLLAAELGEDAPGRPIYARLEPDDDDGELAVRIKVGAVLTRRLYAAEATEAPSGAAYGNPLRGRPGHSPSVPIGSALLARTDAAAARGWRVYRVAQNGAGIYDRWIDYEPARAELALAELRAAAAASPVAALRQAVERQPGHASEKAITRWLAGPADRAAERPGEAPLAGGTAAAAARRRAEPRMTPLTYNRDVLQLTPTVARGLAGRPARPRARRPKGGAVRHRRHPPASRGRARRRDHPDERPRHPPASPSPAAPAASPQPTPRQPPRAQTSPLPPSDLMTAAHADPSRPGPVRCVPRRQPVGTAVGP